MLFLLILAGISSAPVVVLLQDEFSLLISRSTDKSERWHQQLALLYWCIEASEQLDLLLIMAWELTTSTLRCCYYAPIVIRWANLYLKITSTLRSKDWWWCSGVIGSPTFLNQFHPIRADWAFQVLYHWGAFWAKRLHYDAWVRSMRSCKSLVVLQLWANLLYIDLIKRKTILKIYIRAKMALHTRIH